MIGTSLAWAWGGMGMNGNFFIFQEGQVSCYIHIRVAKSFESFEKVPKGSFNPLFKGFFQRISKDFKGFTLWVKLSISILTYNIISII